MIAFFFFLNRGKYPIPETGCDLLKVTGIEIRVRSREVSARLRTHDSSSAPAHALAFQRTDLFMVSGENLGTRKAEGQHPCLRPSREF